MPDEIDRKIHDLVRTMYLERGRLVLRGSARAPTETEQLKEIAKTVGVSLYRVKQVREVGFADGSVPCGLKTIPTKQTGATIND